MYAIVDLLNKHCVSGPGNRDRSVAIHSRLPGYVVMYPLPVTWSHDVEDPLPAVGVAKYCSGCFGLQLTLYYDIPTYSVITLNRRTSFISALSTGEVLRAAPAAPVCN